MAYPLVVRGSTCAVAIEQCNPVTFGNVEVALLRIVRIVEGRVGAAVLVCCHCVYAEAGIAFDAFVAAPAACVVIRLCGAEAWKEVVWGELIRAEVA
jgi:hypothetical protein